MRMTVGCLALVLLLAASTAAEAVQCATRRVDPQRAMAAGLPRIDKTRTHTGDSPMAPPDNPNVGDSWLWWTWMLNGPPQAVQRMCTVRGEGEHVYVVVEDSQWQTRVNQEDVDAIVAAWDNSSLGIHPDWGIYQLDSTYFGDVPDELDNDPKVYVLYYDFDINADGFFWYFDEYPDGQFPYHSNECEVLYMNSSDNDPGGDYLISVQAHEFEHMIHWLADEGEDAWVDEGMAEVGMWLYGHPDVISSFNGNPDNDLTDFGGAWADYVQCYLWSLYFYEQMGGQAATWAVLHEPMNGVLGYENVLDTLGSPLSFADVFSNWTCANYLDDPALDQGQYGYVGEDLPPFTATLKNSYPVPPTNGSVNRYAADYVRFTNGQPQRLRFDGADTGTWRPRVLFLGGGVAQHVEAIPLDASDFGTIDLSDFGETTDEVILVVGKTAPNGTTSYQYGTEGIPAAAGDLPASLALRLLPGQPNPLRSGGGVIRLELPERATVRVGVYDAAGRLVQRLAETDLAAGVHPFSWDGRDATGREAPAGIYWVRAETQGRSTAAKWVRVD
ncbi:MAG: FlgD immunoglobulin-like domain containing protein [Candidatus Eisenbacteria bacterium]|nr:FlgD immunoglobulin-like domain containing protein [Candidatus Eisenbacteria bacterium]